MLASQVVREKRSSGIAVRRVFAMAEDRMSRFVIVFFTLRRRFSATLGVFFFARDMILVDPNLRHCGAIKARPSPARQPTSEEAILVDMSAFSRGAPSGRLTGRESTCRAPYY
jgi:hypothetical protein